MTFETRQKWTPRPHTRPSLASIRATLRDVVGADIAANGTPKSLGPLVIGVTGYEELVF